MARYEETRNAVTGQVTSTGTNPYKQQMTRYGNRGQGVRQAAAARKRLMALRGKAKPAATTPSPTPSTDGVPNTESANPVTGALAGAAEWVKGQNAKAAADAAKAKDAADVKAQAEKFAQLRKEGKRPGFNLGLSQNEIAYNKAVRNSIQGTKNRVQKLRELLGNATNANQRTRIQNKIGRQNYRRQNFKSLLFAPEGENAPTLPQYERMGIEPGQGIPRPSRGFRPRPLPGQQPKPSARPGMRKPTGNNGGVAP